eukprot:2407829-Amphidinium_carterae.1
MAGGHMLFKVAIKMVSGIFLNSTGILPSPISASLFFPLLKYTERNAVREEALPRWRIDLSITRLRYKSLMCLGRTVGKDGAILRVQLILKR